MLVYNNKEVKKVFIGDQEVEKIYLNNEIVYEIESDDGETVPKYFYNEWNTFITLTMTYRGYTGVSDIVFFSDDSSMSLKYITPLSSYSGIAIIKKTGTAEKTQPYARGFTRVPSEYSPMANEAVVEFSTGNIYSNSDLYYAYYAFGASGRIAQNGSGNYYTCLMQYSSYPINITLKKFVPNKMVFNKWHWTNRGASASYYLKVEAVNIANPEIKVILKEGNFDKGSAWWIIERFDLNLLDRALI